MKIKKKFDAGTARVYISRKKALKKLQLNLKDFRRICILKGIYPREPNHVKKANKGSTENKIFYHVKDINFLAQEPLLKKFRDYKVFLKKVTHARAKRDRLRLENLLQSKPEFNYDHLVKERYPTFLSALRDLDDSLCLCFSFAALTQSKIARVKIINQCRKLVTEFMHYVIESNALRKVFISIKGVYYQAEIMGERITWMVGHERSVGRSNELDFSTMANFVDFYTCMLSFVNYRLFKSIGLFYPPQLQHLRVLENNYEFERSYDLDDRIYSLAFPLKRTDKTDMDSVVIDTFTDEIDGEDLADKLHQTEVLKTLFSKYKIFLNREVPKEPLAFVIRSCGGFVCWEDCSPNSITESSELITHQIVDRNVVKLNINRTYIQPQWVFDCFNARRILPSVKYAPSATLPPHLSPFTDQQEMPAYIASEIEQATRKNGEDATLGPKSEAKEGNKRNKQQEQAMMSVQKSKVHRESQQKKINEEGHNLKLREMMIPKKHKRVYAKIKHGMKRKAKESNKLAEKRAKLMKEGSKSQR